MVQLGVLFAIVAGGSVLGLASGEEPRAEGQTATRPASLSSITESQLRRLLLDRPSVPITQPRNGPRARRARTPPPAPIVNRRCRIIPHPQTGWYLLTFIANRTGKAETPLWVLPSRLLAEIEQLANRRAAIFRVSGERTSYKNRKFIFLSSVSVERGGRGPSEAMEVEAKPTPEVNPPEQPKEAEDREAPDEASSADHILRGLLRRRPARLVAAPSDPEPVIPAESVAPGGDRAQVEEAHRGMRIDRRVRIALDNEGKWWEARFESDNTLQDQPIRLLPCKLLEHAEQMARGGSERTKTARLHISGEITQYKQRRYLLLRKVIREREMGEF